MKDKAEMIAWIDGASLEQLLSKWRFAPSGDPLLQGEVGEHFSKTMFAKRDADNAAWVAASKSIGWGR
jgi:hypothetical protein